MKQKLNLNDPITRKELSDVLKYYPTKEELQTAENKLREYFSQAQENLNVTLDKKFVDRMVTSQAASKAESDYKFLMFQEDMDRKFGEFANRILTAIDPLLQELETRQQDREITSAQIHDLDRRVTKLENV